MSGFRSAEDRVPGAAFCSRGCNAGAKPEGRSDQLIAFAFALTFFLLLFSAQKTHVKPPTRIFPTQKSRTKLTNPAPIQRFRASSPLKNKSQNRGMFTPSNSLNC
jgi:hypothetical protein